MTERQDTRAVRYLLDEMPPDERDAFEDEYATDENVYTELLAVENELIDGYCEGTLPPGQRERFEQHYLDTAEGLQRVEFARTLTGFLAARRRRPAQRTRARPPRGPARWLPWAAALAVAATASAIVARQQGETRRARAERESQRHQIALHEQRAREQDRRLTELGQGAARAEERAQALAELVGVGAADALRSVSLVLTSGQHRDATAPRTLALEPGVAIVRLQLRLSGTPRARYRASLQTAEGRALWVRDGLRPSAESGDAVLALAVPAAALSTGHYIIALTDETALPRGATDAEFVFEVRRTR